MIFVTVGSSSFAFQRLIDALTGLDPEELVVQHGTATPPGGNAVSHAYLPFDDILKYMASASIVIAHAGVGSILCARRAGHVPVVVPRLRSNGEAVDDHQMGLAVALASTGRVVMCANPVTDLAACTIAARSLEAEPPRTEHRLAIAISEELRPRGTDG